MDRNIKDKIKKEPTPPETTISYCKRASEKLHIFEKKINAERKNLFFIWLKDKKQEQTI